jgi:hypothetical protein
VTGREAIFAALFAKLIGAGGFVTTGRTLKPDLPAVSQPALFLLQAGQDAVTGTSEWSVPTRWTLHAHAYIYAHAQNPGANGNAATLLNTLLDAIEVALAVEPATGRQTLGGLVSHCSISGAVETDEGLLGEQTVAVIPIEIVPFP